MRVAASAILAIGLWALPASAAETPLALYKSGQFAQAEAAGIAQNDSAGLAIAARAFSPKT